MAPPVESTHGGRAPPDLRQGAGGVSSRVPLACLVVFAVVWTALAVAPRFREDWLLENLLTFVAVPAAVFGRRRFRFSDRAYVQATIFLDPAHDRQPLHLLRGAGRGLGARRVRPRRATTTTAWCTSRSASSCCGRCASWDSGAAGPGASPSSPSASQPSPSSSVLYELIEWASAAVVDPTAGTAYLGTQGDDWDAQKDMGLALAGAVLAAGIEWALDRRRGSRSARSGVKSLRVS